MRRMAPMKPSRGLTWSPAVRAHVATHQHDCLGKMVGMPGHCMGSGELDHVRASGGMGMKSDYIAINAAQLCTWHHSIKTREGRVYRPLLIAVIARLAAGCEDCQKESIERYGVPLQEVAA